MGTAVVSIILAVIVAAVIAKMVINEIKGKSGSCSCGGSCAGCSAGCGHSIPIGASDDAKNVSTSVKTIVQIDGMACGMCEAHINDVIRKTFSVQKVASSHKTGQCEIVSRHPIPEDELKRAIEATGYRMISMTTK